MLDVKVDFGSGVEKIPYVGTRRLHQHAIGNEFVGCDVVLLIRMDCSQNYRATPWLETRVELQFAVARTNRDGVVPQNDKLTCILRLHSGSDTELSEGSAAMQRKQNS